MEGQRGCGENEELECSLESAKPLSHPDWAVEVRSAPGRPGCAPEVKVTRHHMLRTLDASVRRVRN